MLQVGLEAGEKHGVTATWARGLTQQLSRSLTVNRSFTRSFTRSFQLTMPIAPAAPGRIKRLYAYPVFDLKRITAVRFEGPNHMGQATRRLAHQDFPLLLLSHWGVREEVVDSSGGGSRSQAMQRPTTARQWARVIGGLGAERVEMPPPAAMQRSRGLSAPVVEEPAVQERRIFQVTREHRPSGNLPVPSPMPGNGEDVHQVEVPEGLRFARWELHVDASAGAGARVHHAPDAGATGRQRVQVAWWYLPFGHVRYRLEAFASPTGEAAPRRVVVDRGDWMAQANQAISQGLPVNLVLEGQAAKGVHEGVVQQINAQARQQGLARAQVVDCVAGCVVTIAVVIAVVVALGLVLFAGVMIAAMEKGYDVSDTRYNTEVGEGATRQKHEMVFNLRPPGAA